MTANRYLVIGELMDVPTLAGLYDFWVDAQARRDALAKQPAWKNVRVLEVVEKIG